MLCSVFSFRRQNSMTDVYVTLRHVGAVLVGTNMASPYPPRGPRRGTPLYQVYRGTPLYQVYKYVPPQRAWFLSRFGLKMGIDFEHLGLKLGMVIGGTFTKAYELFLPSNRDE